MTELIEGNVRVELDDIGEGQSGEYDPSDPHDVSLFRFYVQHLQNGEWVDVDDASYCTQLPTDLSDEMQQRALRILMDRFGPEVEAGSPVKKLGEELSWLAPNDLTPHPHERNNE